jgi:hypothetical protein
VRVLLVACAAPVLAASCGGRETVTVAETATQTETQSVTVTATEATAVGLPRAVAETHARLLAAAASGDYEELRPLIGPGFSYTFGGPVAGGPIAFWQQTERESDERPMEILRRILELPYTLSAGTYVWPFAYDKAEQDLTPHERQLLGDLAESFGAGSGYLGWRTGIRPDGTWVFFVAGD